MSRPTADVIPPYQQTSSWQETRAYFHRLLVETFEALGVGLDSSENVVAVSLSAYGHALLYSADVARVLSDRRKIVLTLDLVAGARAGKVRVELLSRFGPRLWAWHFDSMHVHDMGVGT